MVKWFNLKGNTQRNGFVVYNGEQLVGTQSDVPTVPWWQL